MSSVSNAEREGRCFGDIYGTATDLTRLNTEPSGDFRRITQSLLRDIPSSDPHSQSRLGWGGEQTHGVEDGNKARNH